MCFDYDADWNAEINEEIYHRVPVEEKCWECHSIIPAGAWRYHLEQQEYEACQICEDDCSEDYRGGEDGEPAEPCPDGEHEYGETFSASLCVGCCKIRAAMYDLEAQEGCPEHSRTPPIGVLSEELSMDRMYNDSHYTKRALEMFPELAGHKLLQKK